MTFREIEKILKCDGWYYYDTVGSHIQYKHRIKPRKSDNTQTWRRCKARDIKFYFETSRFEVRNGGKYNETRLSSMFLQRR